MFCFNFKIFPLKSIKFPNISPIEIVMTFTVWAALLKKSVENDHFHAFSTMRFQEVDRYGKKCLYLTLSTSVSRTMIAEYAN